MLDSLLKLQQKQCSTDIASPELETNHAVQSLWKNYSTSSPQKCYSKLFDIFEEENKD